MRTTFLLTVGLVVAMAMPADAAKLRIGDPAPKLIVDEWLVGAPIEVPPAGGAYITVIEFWATWCGPCVASIPDTSALQRHYQDKGVKVIGLTSQDPSNDLKTVRKFVDEHKKDIAYTIAFEKTEKMYDAYLRASGQNGIPTAFVVDKQGRVAWIGHPMDGMKEVVERMVAGTFDIRLARQVADLKLEMVATSDMGKRDELLARWAQLDPSDPEPHMWHVRGYLWDHEGKSEKETQKMIAAASRALDAAKRRSPAKMLDIAMMFADPTLDEGFRRLIARAVQETEEAGRKDVDVLISRVGLLTLLGRHEEAMTLGRSAASSAAGKASQAVNLAYALASMEHPGPHNALAVEIMGHAVAAEPANRDYLASLFFLKAFAARESTGLTALGGRIVQLAGEDAMFLNEFAWSILEATPESKEATRVALTVAKEANRLTKAQDWSILDTLALAMYKTGDVEGAVQTQGRAIGLCDAPYIVEELQERLHQYKSGA